MAGFIYTYDLQGNNSKGHILASGVSYTQKLTTEVLAAQKSPKKLEALRARWTALKAQKSQTLAEQEEQRLLKKALDYLKSLESSKSIGHTQLAADIVRPGFDVVFEGVVKGDKKAATAAAQQFMEGLSLAQQLLVNQSQGLLSPTTHFLSESLKFEGTKKINANTLSVGQGVFSKVGSDLKIIRQDDFYSFNDQGLDNLDSAKFYFKAVGQPIQSALISGSNALYVAIRSAVSQRQTKNGIVSVSYEDEKGQKVHLEIEPIISVSNTIQMGEKIESLSWQTSVVTHADNVKLDDALFEKGKIAVKAKTTPKAPVKSEPKGKTDNKHIVFTPQVVKPTAQPIPEILAAIKGPGSSRGNQFRAWVGRHPNGFFLGTCLVAGAGLGAFGGPLGIIIGVIAGAVVGIAVPIVFPGLMDRMVKAIAPKVSEQVAVEPELSSREGQAPSAGPGQTIEPPVVNPVGPRAQEEPPVRVRVARDAPKPQVRNTGSETTSVREQLAQRGDNLNRVAENASNLEKSSAEFLDMTRQLREQQKQTSFFGFTRSKPDPEPTEPPPSKKGFLGRKK